MSSSSPAEGARGFEAAGPEVQSLARALLARRWRLVCAESCTGGLIAAACTAIPGSSAWFERGHVTYSNQAKTEMLDVPAALIADKGAVSEEVACAMAEGALRNSHADLALAVTGIAGPDGGTPDKPVGTVWIGWAVRGGQGAQASRLQFDGDRASVRLQTLFTALRIGLRALSPGSGSESGGG